MKIGLDTSVVLRLLTGEPEALARLALAEMREIHRQGAVLLVSDLVVSEVYFALQHHYGVPKSEALSLLARFLGESGVQSLGAASTVLSHPHLATANPGIVDRLIHAGYAQATEQMLTFERSAARLPRVRVLTARSGTEIPRPAASG
jgi:predicted nucleic acid-binding protein